MLATLVNLDLAVPGSFAVKVVHIGKKGFLNHNKLGVGNTKSANHLLIWSPVRVGIYWSKRFLHCRKVWLCKRQCALAVHYVDFSVLPSFCNRSSNYAYYEVP